MQKLLILPTILLGLIFFTGCANSSNESTEEDTTVEETANLDDGDAAITGMQDAMKKMEESIKSMNDGEEVEVVDFRELKKLLPERLAGLNRTEHKGAKTGAMGIKVSNAEATYEDGDKKIEIEITDTGGLGIAKMGLAAWTTVEIDSESDDGFERTYRKDGMHYYEKYEASREYYSIKTYAEERLFMDVEAWRVDPDKVKKAVEKMRFSKVL